MICANEEVDAVVAEVLKNAKPVLDAVCYLKVRTNGQ